MGLNFCRAEPVWSLKQSGCVVDRVGRMGDLRADLDVGRLVEVLADVLEPDEEEMHAVFLGG